MAVAPVKLICGRRDLTLDQPRIMGILNVTPDSFSDGGQFQVLDTALNHVDSMLKSGADIIDVGGESTRPGAADVPEQLELDRILPIVEAIESRFDTIVSLDTSKPAVIREGAAVGAGLINDVRALQEPGALEAVAESGLPVCLMHMQGQPRSMQHSPSYQNVVEEVKEFLLERSRACHAVGIVQSQIVLDPGFGFGKNLEHNLSLLKGLGNLCSEAPVLTGLSRKRMFGQILENDLQSRVVASVTGALLCVQNGASIVRVHDVEETAHALAVYRAVDNA